MLTQRQLYEASRREIAEVNLIFLFLAEHGMTREDLAKNIARRPGLWSRFDSWLDVLPSHQ